MARACERRNSVNCMPVSSTRFQSGSPASGIVGHLGGMVGPLHAARAGHAQRAVGREAYGLGPEIERENRRGDQPDYRDGAANAATSRGASAPRSAATNAGGGSGTGFVAVGTGDAREHERERHAERGRERAVGRRPVADHHDRVAEAGVHELGHRPARVCPRPRAGARPRSAPRPRATPRPAPGRRCPDRSGRDSWRRTARPTARRRRRGAAARSRSRGASPRPPRRLGRVRRHVSKPCACSASTTPGPGAREHAAPGRASWREQRGRGLRAASRRRRDRRRRRPPRAVRRCRATRPLELFVRNTTRRPASRSRVTPAAEPSIGVSPRQITPSRSQQTTGRLSPPASLTLHRRLSRELVQLNAVQRLSGTLFSPGETFRDVNRKPTIIVPIVLGIILALAGGAFFSWKVKPDWIVLPRPGSEKIDRGRAMTPEQIEQQVTFSKKLVPVFPIIGAVGTVIAYLVIAGIMALGMMLIQENDVQEDSFRRLLVVCSDGAGANGGTHCCHPGAGSRDAENISTRRRG